MRVMVERCVIAIASFLKLTRSPLFFGRFGITIPKQRRLWISPAILLEERQVLAAGYWAPAAYPIALYRGWIGGIVSVDGKHRSRFSSSPEATYYLLVLLLQLVPYSLAGGAGVNIGLARVHPLSDYAGAKLFGIPREALLDAARIGILIVPLFAIASACEFLFSPN